MFHFIIQWWTEKVEKTKDRQMLVTCYYDIYQKPERFLEYLYLFYDLGISGLPIILFTDPSLVSKFRIFPSTVKVVGIPITEFKLYQQAMSYTRDLPTNRTPQKDTKEFYALMNTKMEFIKRASDLTDNNKLIWIDYGILKIVKNQERFINKLKKVNEAVFQKATFPGCWSFGRQMNVDTINWRFCGGFFVMPRQHVERFYKHSECVLRDFCTQAMYKLTWETNVWTVIESCAERGNMEWYFADHNDTIVLNIQEVMDRGKAE